MRPFGLLGHSLALLLTAFVLIQGLALALAWTQVIRPLSEQAADEMAARLVLAAQTWVELPPETRTDYENELLTRHDLVIEPRPAMGPGLRFQRHDADTLLDTALERALSTRVGQPIHLLLGTDPDWLWVDIDMGPHALRVGFLHARMGFNALWIGVGFFVLSGLLLMGLATALVGRLAVRLRDLSASAQVVGQGGSPLHLPETGSRELVDLTRAFNRMAGEVAALLENRTVLLAGISHDLRTPLTRLRLALSLLPPGNAERVRQMEADVTQMNRLIGDMLVLARDLQPEAASSCDLVALLHAAVAACAEPARIHVSGPEHCVLAVAESPLRRIVANLIDNALRHGGVAVVNVDLVVTEVGVRILICDQGAGIPPAERAAVFRPFYRLDAARTEGGSGLGLAIVRQLADAYGWQVSLDERLGGGLCAQIEIPRGQRGAPG